MTTARDVRAVRVQHSPTQLTQALAPVPFHGAVFRRVWIIALVGLMVLLPARALYAQYCEPEVQGQVRPGATALPVVAQLGISSALGRDQHEYHAVAKGDGLSLANPRYGLSADFTAEKVDFRLGTERWGLALRGYGYGDELRALRPVAARANANRVEYTRGGLTEWYLNGPLGIEQGFTVQQRPGKSRGEPLTLVFAVSGDLAASVDSDQRGLTLNKNGTPVLRYGGLVVNDADGRQLRASLEASGETFRISVDDAGARYPLSIDPVVQAVKLTACDTTDHDYFGHSVAVSGDGKTAVATTSPSTSLRRGSAFVFLEPQGLLGGWGGGVTPNFAAARLIASDYDGPTFGEAVGISSDGSTIAVGAGYATNAGQYIGAVYVFVRPASGWNAAAGVAFTETAKLTVVGDPDSSALGFQVAISSDGSTIVASGSIFPPDEQFASEEAAYVFTRPASGWSGAISPTAKLHSSDVHPEFDPSGGRHFFGRYQDLAISGEGNMIAAGSHATGFAGGVYVFAKPGGGWTDSTETAKLTRTDAIFLGSQLDISSDGGTLAARADGTDGNASSVRVFANSGGAWNQVAKLTPSDGPIVFVGLSISGDGHTIATGNYEPGSGPGRGYIFAQPAGGWTLANETQQVTPSDGQTGDSFGSSIDINDKGNIMVFGSPFHMPGSNDDQGAIYVFTGFAGTPTASVSPTSLSLTNQVVGTTSSTKSVTLTNTGNAPLNVTAVTSSSPRFTTTQNCKTASPIIQGGSCTENVAFTPTATGTVSGTLTFTDNSGGTNGSTQQVQLSGTGVNYSLVVVPDSKNIAAGKSASYNVGVLGANGFTGQVSLSCADGPAGTTCTMSPTSVNLSASTPAAGTNATVNVPAGAAKGTYTMTITGASGAATRTATASLTVK